MRTTRDLTRRNSVTVKWADDQRATRILHFLVRGSRGGTRAGFHVCIKDLFAELGRLGVWEMIGIPTKTPKNEPEPIKPGMAFAIANSLLFAGVIAEDAVPTRVQDLVQKCIDKANE